MNPNTQRSQAFRARQKALGLTEVRGIWASPEIHKPIKSGAEVLQWHYEHTGKIKRRKP